MSAATVLVAAAVIERGGRYLLTKRQDGVHLAGRWEFPGGKCEPQETLTACLAREVLEELNVQASVGREIFTIAHEYPGRRVELHFFSCDIAGHPTPQQGQEMRWVARDELRSLQFPAADAQLIEMLVRQD